MEKLIKFLDAEDDDLRGVAVWALKRLHYTAAFDKINAMAEDAAMAWIYENDRLQQKEIGQMINEG